MTITQMQYYIEVYNTMSYTKAAENLHVTQPAISQAMRDLEKECAVPLFKRKGNAFTITEEGRLLYEGFSKIMRRYNKIEYLIHELHLSRNIVRAGFSTMTGKAAFLKVAKQFLIDYPEIKLSVVEDTSKHQFDMLDDDALDVIFTQADETAGRNASDFSAKYGRIDISSDTLDYYVKWDHPLAQHDVVTAEEIASYPLVLLSETYHHTVQLNRLFRQKGLTPNILHFTSQVFTVEQFVESGIAGGFLPRSLAPMREDIVGIPFEGMEETHHTAVFWRKDRYVYQAISKFLGIARKLNSQQDLQHT